MAATLPSFLRFVFLQNFTDYLIKIETNPRRRDAYWVEIGKVFSFSAEYIERKWIFCKYLSSDDCRVRLAFAHALHKDIFNL